MFVVIKKKTVIVIALIVVLALMICVCAGGVYLNLESGNKRLVPVYSVETRENKVALTFDCAWGSDKTREIMALVEKEGYKCTFFATGFWIDDNEVLVKEIHERGHQIGNHSKSHLHLKDVENNGLDEEISAVNERIFSLTGTTPTCFRAPFGEYDNGLINLLENKNMLCIQWSIDSLDWKGISGSEIAERVVNRVKSGDIILFHNNSDHILEGLPLVLMALKNKGLTSVRVDELVYFDEYTINAEGKQIKNS